jgi:uncharacterized protein YcbX
MPELTLSEIYIYPIKSAKGISLKSSSINHRGLVYDRCWMVVDQNHQFLTQRKIPQLALISVSIKKDFLYITAPKMNLLSIPIEPTKKQGIDVNIWKDTCSAQYAGIAADKWISQYLGQPAKLVYLPENSVRKIDPLYAVNDFSVSFADGFPLLLISEASLKELNGRLKQSLSMDRFRPNLVVRGCSAFEEDHWDVIKIGSVLFQIVKPCTRCVITTIDQSTGKKGKEPLKTLAKFRNFKGKIYFGQNLIHKNIGRLETGNFIEIFK